MSRSFEPGRYRARMQSAAMGVSAKKKTPEVRFFFEVIGRYEGGEVIECASDSRIIFAYLTDGSIDSFIQDLMVFGYDRDTYDEIDEGHANAFPFAGIQFDCRCEYENFDAGDGKGMQPRERWRIARGSQRGEPIEARQLRELNQKYGSYLKKGNRPAPMRQPAPTQARPSVSPTDYANGGSDIPF